MFLLTHSFKLPKEKSPLNSTSDGSSLVCSLVGRKITAVLQVTRSTEFFVQCSVFTTKASYTRQHIVQKKTEQITP